MPRSSRRQRRAPAVRATARRQRQDRSSILSLSGVTETSTIPGVAILPLRAFLGITFLYAGWQKLTDPGFFRLGSSTYIGSQLRGFSHGSPINFLMSHFLEHAQAIGALTIVTELGIGLLVLLGLFTRLAALGGLVLNLVLFLSASWHVYPYFLGSDIVFVMCWLTLVITGPGGFCLDAVIQEPLRARIPQGLQRLIMGPLPPAVPDMAEEVAAAPPRPSTKAVSLMTRWEALAAAAGTAVLVILGLAPRNTALGSVANGSTRVATAAPRTGGSSGPPAGAQKVASLSQLPVNSALATTDPKSGDPAVIVHTSQSGVHAYDAVCTHAGCTVEYDPQYKLLVCPCHGGAFDPAHGAQVVAGPPPQPLPELPITIRSNGDIYIA